MNLRRPALILLAAAVSACSAQKAAILPARSPANFSRLAHAYTLQSPNPIKHVVILVMENRSVDNLFNGFPGANTQSWGLDSHGNTITLQQVSLKTKYDLVHSHAAFGIEYDNGKMDGFDLEPYHLESPGPTPTPL